jgi:CHAT domain-containing protein
MNILVVSQPETEGLSPLPGADEEVRRLMGHFPSNTIIHLDRTQATADAVLQTMDKHHCPIIHFACHGLQNVSKPLDSAFMMHDGELKLSRFMSKSFQNAALAFLSACQTATGDANLPEETVHLAASMLAAGFRSVVGTMWSIRDEDAPLVADVFYRFLIQDQALEGARERFRPAYALHEAVRALRETAGEDNFVRWVPFVHFGL